MDSKNEFTTINQQVPFMRRTALDFLRMWLVTPDRKPLVLRGARQVGKTWVVRQFASMMDKTVIELNFEKRPSLASFFNSNDPQQILIDMSSQYGMIDIQNSILFLDEIQACPEIIAKLRWFAEELPDLPVIAAGSLLEFVLGEHTFSMPVGRISYLHIEPMSFEEFLLACEKGSLLSYLQQYQSNQVIPLVIHEQLTSLFKEYSLIGGMPAVVATWLVTKNWVMVNQRQNDLLATYRDDFSKYNGRIAVEKIDHVMMATTRMLGQKTVFSRALPSESSQLAKTIIQLLTSARILHTVKACSANGIPLSSEIKEKLFKLIFLDTGLCSAALGLRFEDIYRAQDITLINSGALAEQVVGQLLRTIEPSYKEPSLYYWLREEEKANAEIDYVIAHASRVIPIEVKAGSSGAMKSLHTFMGIKKLSFAVRISSAAPQKIQVNVKNHKSEPVVYDLLSIPFYLIGQLHRLIDSY